MIHVISLGAGVQSSTMALMAAHGEITPMPECAIFADTGAEPKAVYRHLEWLISVLPFPVHVVSDGNLRDDIWNQHKRASYGRPPFFVINDDGLAGQLRRQCTGDYKLNPIRRKARALAGLTRKRSPDAPVLTQWIGISTDEASRMKPSGETWRANRWPLIEKNMTRGQCLEWLSYNGYPRPPKSACTFCPYRPNDGWRDMRDNDPESWADAIAVDNLIRDGMPGVQKSRVFIHRSLLPLSAVDLRSADDGQASLFEDECEGTCGV